MIVTSLAFSIGYCKDNVKTIYIQSYILYLEAMPAFDKDRLEMPRGENQRQISGEQAANQRQKRNKQTADKRKA